MLTPLQAMLMGLLQGVAELFPISSLGHIVILPELIGWKVDQHDPLFLSFIVATHLATALVLLGFYWQDWVRIVRGLFRSLQNRRIDSSDTYAKIGWLLVVSTIPAGVLGILFEEKLKDLFASPRPAALFLLLNGLLLLGAEFLRRRSPRSDGQNDTHLAQMSWWSAVKIGLLQCLALLPGFSRTGATLSGGLLSNLSHESAARYSFLLATPIILAAAMLKIPELAFSTPQAVGTIVLGALCAACSAYVAVRFLTKYLRTNTLVPFAIYCCIAGALASVILSFR